MQCCSTSKTRKELVTKLLSTGHEVEGAICWYSVLQISDAQIRSTGSVLSPIQAWLSGSGIGWWCNRSTHCTQCGSVTVSYTISLSISLTTLFMWSLSAISSIQSGTEGCRQQSIMLPYMKMIPMSSTQGSKPIKKLCQREHWYKISIRYQLIWWEKVEWVQPYFSME